MGMPRAIQRYEVSLKAFIVRDGRALFVREADTGWWELPGGRIDVGEEWLPHSEVLAREIREELGDGFRLTVHAPAVTWTRQRPSDGVFQFIVARLCTPGGGPPELSGEHDRIAWLTREEAAELDFPEPSTYRDAIRRLWDLAPSVAP